MNDEAMVAVWRNAEQALERGLDPELRERLDALRLEDVRLLPRHSIRVVNPAPQLEPAVRRAG